MSGMSKSDIDAGEDPSRISEAGQAFSRVAVVTLIAIVAAGLVLSAVLLLLTR